MPKNINSATRLKTLLEEAKDFPDNTQVVEAWAKILGVSEANPNKCAIQVAERLGWLHRELELIGPQMRQANYSESLYSGALKNIENSLSTMLLGGSWNQVRQYLRPETFVALAYCSEILPDEESEIAPGDLAEIRERAEDLRNSLAEASVSPRLRKLIEHHIALIEDAIAEYPISGAKALREAARTGLGELIEARDAVKEEKAAPQVGKLGAVWKRVNEAADTALKGEKLAQLGQKAWAFLENML